MVPPKLDHERTKRLEICKQVVLWGKKGTLKSQSPCVITHLPWQTHDSPRIEAQNLVAQGTREIEIFNQVAPR
jgi:hypothetical protein